MAADHNEARIAAALEERVLILDGATGTELERRGIQCRLPLWSTHALIESPATVESIHRDYVDAGADLITANTFRTQRRVLERAGMGGRAAALTGLAVELAQRAASARPGVWVAGSAPTLEDCYRADLVPADDILERDHAAHCEALAAAGADLILVETMNSVREARAAARAAQASGLPFFVSFVSWEGARLLSGEPLADALEAVAATSPLGVMVNCLPPSAVTPLIAILARSGLVFGAYPNLGSPGAGAPRSEERSPKELAELARSWIEAGARIVGGCCGTRPEHIRELARLARSHARSR